MSFTKAFLAILAVVGAANAFTGRATWESLGTHPCPVTCPTTDFRVALPSDLFPNGESCCSTVQVAYQGQNIAVTFTDLYDAGAGSFNISLSLEAFEELAAPELGSIFPVTWNL